MNYNIVINTYKEDIMIEVLFGSRDKENVLQYILAYEKGMHLKLLISMAQNPAKSSNSLKHWKSVAF